MVTLVGDGDTAVSQKLNLIIEQLQQLKSGQERIEKRLDQLLRIESSISFDKLDVVVKDAYEFVNGKSTRDSKELINERTKISL